MWLPRASCHSYHHATENDNFYFCLCNDRARLHSLVFCSFCLVLGVHRIDLTIPSAGRLFPVDKPSTTLLECLDPQSYDDRQGRRVLMSVVFISRLPVNLKVMDGSAAPLPCSSYDTWRLSNQLITLPRTQFAELLSDMYNETLNTVSEHSHDLYVSNICYPAPALTLRSTVSADLSPDVRRRLICSLNSWSFEPHKLPPEEVLACTMLLFEGLFRIDGMKEAVGVSLRKCLPLYNLCLDLINLSLTRTNGSIHTPSTTNLPLRKLVS